MQTNFSTVEIYFIFAFTYCKLTVYEEEEAFARRILEEHKVEFLTSQASESWQKIDAKVLLNLVAGAIMSIIPSILPEPKEIAKRTKLAMGIV